MKSFLGTDNHMKIKNKNISKEAENALVKAENK
jgi:hypothetical protein